MIGLPAGPFPERLSVLLEGPSCVVLRAPLNATPMPRELRTLLQKAQHSSALPSCPKSYPDMLIVKKKSEITACDGQTKRDRQMPGLHLRI